MGMVTSRISAFFVLLKASKFKICSENKCHTIDRLLIITLLEPYWGILALSYFSIDLAVLSQYYMFHNPALTFASMALMLG